MSGNVTIVAIGVIVASRASVGISSLWWPLVSGCGSGNVGDLFGHNESKEKKKAKCGQKVSVE